MSKPLSRRSFTALAASLAVAPALAADDKPKDDAPKPPGPKEATFTRDYEAPKFKPAWKRPQINRLLVQDFVIYAHSDLAMVKKLLKKEPALINAFMDWGAGDWESGLGAAAHMGRHDIAEALLAGGARIDIFCAAVMGQLEAVKAFLTLEPKLIDAKGPHGISLHAHARVGKERSAKVLEYLQTVKKVDFPPPGKKKDTAAKKG